MRRKVRVGVVGCGSVAEKYVPHLQQSAAVELIAVCDPLLERARGLAHAYGIEHTFLTVDQMLSTLDFELVVNLTPMPHGAEVDTPAFGHGVFPQRLYLDFLRKERPDLPLILEHAPGDQLPGVLQQVLIAGHLL